MPFIIDKAIVERERPTYAWYARHVFNMYAYTFKYADELVLDLKDQTTPDRAHLLRPIIPAGWGEQNLYFIRYPSGVMMPIGQSIIKGDLMVVIFRGTMCVRRRDMGWVGGLLAACCWAGSRGAGSGRVELGLHTHMTDVPSSLVSFRDRKTTQVPRRVVSFGCAWRVGSVRVASSSSSSSSSRRSTLTSCSYAHPVLPCRYNKISHCRVTDYQFPWADKKATEAMGIPGRVHRGFFNFASQFFKEFENEVGGMKMGKGGGG